MQILHRLRPIAALLLPVLLGLAVSPDAVAQRTQEANIQPFISLSASEVEKKPGSVRGDMLLANDDHVYFLSSAGGNGIGSIGKLAPDGTLSVLFAMSEYEQGATAFSGLSQGSDGHLYGTTYLGGERGTGVVFRVTLAGEHTVLHTFDGRDRGAFLPYTGVTEGPDGYLYGTTLRGGSNDMGTVYRLNPAGGEFSVILSFTGDNGRNPEGTLLLGPDGLLYGTTLQGGSSNRGVIYRINTAGSIENLYSFPALGAFTSDGVASNSTGSNPRAGLTLGSDGNFYGTAYQGGARGFGTVFRMTPAGEVTAVYSFSGPPFGGAFPLAGVAEGPDGALYGTTGSGGYGDLGTVWRVDLAGNFSMLHGFTNSGIDGSNPYNRPLFAHGNLYVVSYTDGLSAGPAFGAIAKIDQGSAGVLPVELTVTPSDILAGETTSIVWNAPGATECAKTGEWTGEAAASGAETATPISPRVYVYAIRCTFADESARIAYAALNVRVPPQQPVDGGVSGGGGQVPLLLLGLFSLLLTRKIIKETV